MFFYSTMPLRFLWPTLPQRWLRVGVFIICTPDLSSFKYFRNFKGEKLDFLLMNAAQNAQKINDFVLRYLELPLRTELIEVHRLQRCCFSTG